MNWILFRNSLVVSALATLLSVAFGLMAALWLAGLERRWRMIVLVAAVVGLAMPPFLVTNCWLHYLGAAGAWRQWLPFDIFSLGGAIWILSLLNWPITLFMVFGAWRQLEPAHLESDSTLAGWELIRRILIPLGGVALAQAAALTFVLALNNFAVPTILQIRVFTEEIWVRFNTAFDTRGALVLSWPLILVPLLVVAWLARRPTSWPRLDGPIPPELFRRQLGRGWFWACGLGSAALCAVSLGLPLAQLLSAKRTWVELPGAVAAGSSAIWNSFLYAAATATAILVVALVLRTRREASLHSRVLVLLSWLPLLIPGVLLGILLIAVFNRPGLAAFYQSAGIVILAFVIRYFGLGWNIVAQSIAGEDRDLRDAAKLDGANRWQMFQYVHWPQIGPLALAAWYTLFLLCLWDVESMVLVTPPGGETLALRIFNLLHYGHNGQVNALCLTLLGLALTPLLAWAAWRFARGAWSGSGVTMRWLPANTMRISILAALAGGFLAGCSPGGDSNLTRLHSHLFSHVEIIGSRGVGVGELNKPRSVTVDRQDNLFVVDMTGRVQEFSPAGAFVRFWQLPQTDKGKPKGMCRDQQGNIVVVEPHYQRVNHFSTEGKLLAQWGQYGTNAGQFTLPRAIAINSRGEVFVSEYGLLERIQQFKLAPGSPSGTDSASSAMPGLLSVFGQMGSKAGDFNRPEGLCVDKQDRLYVADSCNHRIQIFSSDGKFIRSYGKAGKAIGELSYPYDICVDAAGRQYVCEFGNSRIQVFDAQDQSIEIIGGPGAEPGQFSNPWSVALDSTGNLYVADSLNHRVQKLVRNN